MAQVRELGLREPLRFTPPPDGPECIEDNCQRPPYEGDRCKFHRDVHDYKTHALAQRPAQKPESLGLRRLVRPPVAGKPAIQKPAAPPARRGARISPSGQHYSCCECGECPS